LFLALLTANIFLIDPSYPSHTIKWYEIVVWVWVCSTLLEEVSQFFKEPDSYFSLLSNKMDALLHLLLVTYFILRILAWHYETSVGLVTAYTDVLVVATIACYLRLMNVFAFSKSLGPLFIVIVRLFSDVMRWFFVFLLFMISFQAGIFALTRQAGESGWAWYPGGSMGAGFTAILGDLGNDTMDWMTHTKIGVVLVLVYSLITQVMLVNLLIAMMGDTYSSVKENSDKEWKFSRYSLINDYIASSPYPPPLNLFFVPILFVVDKMNFNKDTRLVNVDLQFEKTVSKTEGKMRAAKEKVLDQEQEEELDTLHTISEVVRKHLEISNNNIHLATTRRDNDAERLDRLEELLRTQEERLAHVEGLLSESNENSNQLKTSMTQILAAIANIQK